MPPGLVCIAAWADRASADERALVVLAMGLPYWMFAAESGFSLWTEAPEAAQVREQLALYELEQQRRAAPAPLREPATSDGPWVGAALFGAVLALVAVATDGATNRVVAAALLDARAVVLRGELWRTVTALTLHADLAHLLGNLAAGALFAYHAARRLGTGLAWLLIVLAGAAGNLATAWVYRSSGHLALGASTAVFAALGLLGGASLRRRPAGGDGTRPRLLPLAAALVLLAFLGGAERTDVVAHAGGFAAGATAGLLVGGFDAQHTRPVLRRLCGATALALVGAAWICALAQARP